jgi:hypothetical protein
MKRSITSSLLTLALVAGVSGTIVGVQAQGTAANANMSFFITSVGKGDGGNYGGLEGADAHCTALAKAAGSTRTNWKAYLSAVAGGGRGAPAIAPVDARDRIGKGPWHNAKGELVANNVDDLYSKKLTKEMLLTEKGLPNSGMGDTPNQHDILTGSDSAGRYLATAGNNTCSNWTSNGEGQAMVGHHDGRGPNANRNFTSWNSSHMSRSCSQADLVATGGAGQLYCFAAN